MTTPATPTQEEIKAVAVELRKHSPYASCYEAEEAIDRAADLIERLAAEKAAGDFWRGVFDEITDKTDREKIEAELHDFRFMMQQVPQVYLHITGHKLSKCNYHANAVIAEADEYQQKLIDEAVQEALERSKDDSSPSVLAHIKPLVWQTNEDRLGTSAYTPFGSYTVCRQEYGGWTWGYCFVEYYDEEQFSCDDLEDGMAKAQAHWVERISPMLTEGPAIPEGWKLVPIEPDDAMLKAGRVHAVPSTQAIAPIYTAMLNASPAPGGSRDAD